MTPEYLMNMALFVVFCLFLIGVLWIVARALR
jgi:hypothetical protein